MIGLQGEPLDQRDYENLVARWIDRERAERSLFRRVNSITGSELVGRNGSGRYEGIAIPYVWPGEDRVREYRLRRDHPEFENGTPKQKYMAPPGRGNLLYLPVGTAPEWLSETSLPIVLTEGEFKTVALFRAALHDLSDAAERPRFLPIGISGVWNWRGTVGKKVDETGTRVDDRGPIPDLSRIEWTGRRVTIVYDRDAQSNEKVGWALAALTKELHSRGAVVRHFMWPTQAPEAKGIDDLLAAVGADIVLSLIEAAPAARRGEDRSRQTQDQESVGIIKKLADEITGHDHFAKDAGGKLYVYRSGVYKPQGDAFIKTRVKELLIEWGMTAKWKSLTAKETVEFISVDAPDLSQRPSTDILNVANGLLNLATLTVLPHTLDFRSSLQLPVKFDPGATCPATEKFLSEVLPGDCQALYFELIAWLMAAIDHIQKAVLLIGEGSNGKSTLLAAMTAFLGKQNVSAIALHRLESDRFAPVRLLGKLANICADLPSAHLAGTSVFKALTGGDEILAERKFSQSFEFRPFARLVFSANQPPKSPDATHAFFRRWLVVPFNRTFEGEAIPRSVLDARLSKPAELSGVLNRALQMFPEVNQNGITEVESMRSAWDEFRQSTDPLAVWLDHATVLLPDAVVGKGDLLTAYNRGSEKAGRSGMTKTAFGLALKRLRPNLEEKQRTIRGKIQWADIGIGLACDAELGGENKG